MSSHATITNDRRILPASSAPRCLRRILLKLGGAVVLLLLVSALSFVLISLAPGDPARRILGNEASAEAVEDLRAQLGLDQPLAARDSIGNVGVTALRMVPDLAEGEPVG